MYLNKMHECTAFSLVQKLNHKKRGTKVWREVIKEKRYPLQYILLLLRIEGCNCWGALIPVLILRNSFLIESSDKTNSKFNSMIIPVFHSISKNLLQYSTGFLPLRATASSLQAFIERPPALLNGSHKARWITAFLRWELWGLRCDTNKSKRKPQDSSWQFAQVPPAQK